MKNTLPTGMLEATRLTGAGRLTEATAMLQRMLGGLSKPDGPSPPANDPRTIDGVAETAGSRGALPPVKPMFGGVDQATVARRGGFHPLGRTPHSGLNQAATAIPNGARFLALMFSNHAGSRPYKLYVPSGYRPGNPVPLIVMLHGCTQSPDDFAVGTRMNEAAEEHTCLVAYPGQIASANMQKCWNWFNENEQRRDGGEPSLIAGITREIMGNYAIDPRRVYVAGLSAGGAAAAIMGETYPDLYAAIGVHSGLACGAARDVPSALTAMRHGGGASPHRVDANSRLVPAIIFHGDADMTVNPRNAEAVVAQSAQDATLRTRAENGRVPGGHDYTRVLHAGADGRTMIEQWVIHGARHAWAGGNPAGSYTDPRGPDATGEMLRFFLEHPAARAP